MSECEYSRLTLIASSDNKLLIENIKNERKENNSHYRSRLRKYKNNVIALSEEMALYNAKELCIEFLVEQLIKLKLLNCH